MIKLLSVNKYAVSVSPVLVLLGLDEVKGDRDQ